MSCSRRSLGKHQVAVSACVVACTFLLFASPASATPTLPVLPVPRAVAIVDDPRPQPKWGFAQRRLTITQGTWVTWSNTGFDTHSVTAADGSFDSGELAAGEGYSFFFEQPGSFEYTCALHPWMQGTVVVVGVAPAPGPAQSP